MAEVNLSIMIDDIIVNDGRREINSASVKKLAQSIEQIGLRHPITVKRKGEQYVLIAGRHRLEAYKKLGREHIAASILSMTNDEARLWEIAENLHRAELTKLERDDNIAEWLKITEQRMLANCQQSKPGPKSAIRAASDEIGVEQSSAHRALKVASLSDEAKEVARETGLDNNRTALLAAAREKGPKAQVARLANYRDGDIRELVPARERQRRDLARAWNEACEEVREEFLREVSAGNITKKWA